MDYEIVNKLIENAISDPEKKNKLIFDGYPRSLSQAKNLDLLLENSDQKINFIFFLNVNKDDGLIEEIKLTSEKQRQYKSGHKYDLEKFGLTENEIITDCKKIYDTFLI